MSLRAVARELETGIYNSARRGVDSVTGISGA